LFLKRAFLKARGPEKKGKRRKLGRSLWKRERREKEPGGKGRRPRIARLLT